MATLGNISARAQEWRNAQRQKLMQQQGLVRGNYSTYVPNVMDPLGVGHPNVRQPGALNLPYGVMFQEADLDRLIAMQGGNPYSDRGLRQRTSGGQSGGAGGGLTGAQGVPQLAGAETEQSLLEQTIAALAADRDSANKANLARYDEGHGLLTELGQRNQDRVANWGIAAAEDLEERASESLGNQMASLASRGLSNSTVPVAFQQRNARDLAREQQRISEMRDERASEYDTRDVNNLVGFVERREDVAPSLEFLANLALQYEQAGDDEGLNQALGEIRRLRQQLGRGSGGGFAQRPRGFSPAQAARFQASASAANPLGVAQQFLGGAFGGQNLLAGGGRGSNRYPTPRGSGDPSAGFDRALDRRAGQQRRLQQRRGQQAQRRAAGRPALDQDFYEGRPEYEYDPALY